MHAPTLSRPIPLAHPWWQQLLERGRELSLRWRQWRSARRAIRELDAIADLSDHTLQDIGAPEWLRLHAQWRREAEQQRLLELRSGWASDAGRERGW